MVRSAGGPTVHDTDANHPLSRARSLTLPRSERFRHELRDFFA